MDIPWLDLPFTFITLLLTTRLAYDHYGDVAAAFAGSFSLQIFLFYCFARWYCRTMMDPRAAAVLQPLQPPVLTPLTESDAAVSLSNRCFAVVFLLFVPLTIVLFEQRQVDLVAYVLCFVNIIVVVVWVSPGRPSAAARSLLWTMSDDDEDSGCDRDKCPVCLGGMREAEQALRELPGCKHRFHEHCIWKWLRSRPSCPVCRSAVERPAGDGEPADGALRLV